MTSFVHKTTQGVRRREYGLTMIELLVTVVILSALIAGLSQLVVTNSMNANATGTLAGIADSGRTAIQLLATDIRRAGYLGGNIEIIKSTETQGASDYAINCVADNADWARMVNQPIVGIDAPDDEVPIAYDCIADEWLRGDALTMRYALPVAVAVADMDATKLYLRATVTKGEVFLGSEEAAATASTLIDDITARNYELAAYTYFVAPTGRTCQGKNIPALFRKTIGDNGLPVSQELLAGVENLQFRYLVGNRYYDADKVPLESGKWPPVNAVEITVLVRAECPESGFKNNNRTFDLGGVIYTPEDDEQDFRRQIFTTTTQLRN